MQRNSKLKKKIVKDSYFSMLQYRFLLSSQGNTIDDSVDIQCAEKMIQSWAHLHILDKKREDILI